MAAPAGGRRERRTDMRWGDGYLATAARSDGTTPLVARWPDRRPDGHTVWGGKTFPDTDAGRDAATDHLRAVARLKRDDRYVPSSQLTVREVVEQYLERDESRWKPATYATYRQRAERLIYPGLGTVRVEALTTAQVQHWIDHARRAGSGARTIENSGGVLSAALREAARLGIIPVNPAVGLRYPTARRTRIPTWSVDEVQRVIAAIAGDPFGDAVYRVMLTTGMRPGELHALRWAGVDLDDRVIVVSRTISKDRDGRVAMGDSTTTGRERENVVPASVVSALRTWSTEQKRRRLAAVRWSDLGLVFERGDGVLLPLQT